MHSEKILIVGIDSEIGHALKKLLLQKFLKLETNIFRKIRPDAETSKNGLFLQF